MADVPDLTIEILKQIRDAVIETNSRLDQTNSRLDQTNSRLDQIAHEQEAHARAIVGLERRQGEFQTALVGALGALQQGQNLMVDELRKVNARLDNVLIGPMGQGVRDHETRIGALETAVAALERRTG